MMHQPQFKEDSNSFESFNEEKFEKMYKSLEKKYFPPRDGYPNQERVELKPLWEYLEKEAAVDGVLF